MEKENCIFCKLVAGDIPSYTVYEDDVFLAFLDIRPLNLGHTLVIPKDHHRWVWDVPQIGEYMEVCQRIAHAQRRVLNTEKIESRIIGEEVPHAHIWLIPRFKDDGHGTSADISVTKDIPEKDMTDIAHALSEQL